jgi:hypothetical protein
MLVVKNCYIWILKNLFGNLIVTLIHPGRAIGRMMALIRSVKAVKIL